MFGHYLKKNSGRRILNYDKISPNKEFTNMVRMTKNKDYFVIQFTKADISNAYLKKVMNKFRLESILSKNQMTAADAWELSEKAKDSWWKKNKKQVLGRIKN